MTAVLQELVKCCRKENPSAVMIVYHVLKERSAIIQVTLFVVIHVEHEYMSISLLKAISYVLFQIPLIVSLAPRSSGLMQRETLVSPSL